VTETPPPIPQQSWTARAVREGKVVPNPKGAGQLQNFYIDFNGADGFQAKGTYWRRKAGNAPKVGESYAGTITSGEYGYRFKMDSSGGGGGRGGGGRDWKPESQFDPEKTARIGRSHAQGMALEYANQVGALAGLDEGHLKGDPRTIVPDLFWRIVDQFQADVDQAAAKAAQGAGGVAGPAAPSPASVQDSDPQATSERLYSLLEGAGVNPAAAKIITDYALTQMSPQEQDAAIDRLQNPNLQVAAVSRLIDRTEEFHGEPLPEGSPDDGDDIPF
jgi:hypothetical protein